MRRQYCLRKSDDGLRAWDVGRLIELSRNFSVKRISISQIHEVNEPYWFEHEQALPTCMDVLSHIRLIEETDLCYPIILGVDGRLMDGMHRVLKALLQGKETIDAVQFESMPEPDFVGVAVEDLPY